MSSSILNLLKEEDTNMADWSEVPYDMLGAIALKLGSIEDLVSFSIVCRSWNWVFLQVKQLCQPTTPWLVLAESKEENPEGLRKVFSLHTNRCFQLKIPETIGRRCWGSNYGWIVTVDLDREMHLFNPITKARLCLPHQSTLPHQPVGKKDDDDEWYRDAFVHRAFVIRIHDEFLVMVVFGVYYFAFARPGDQVWTPIAGARDVHDVRYYNGRILAIFRDGAIRWCDLDSPNAKVIDYLPPPPRILKEDKVSNLHKLYLVNSFGDLLVVLRYKEEIPDENDPDNPMKWDEDVCYETTFFLVFRPDFNTKEWVEVDDLGDSVLFVGENCSITTVNAGKYRRNHVYFTDDEFEFWKGPREGAGHDMGAYDMENDEIIPFYEGGDFRSKFCTPFWFIPKF